jgi:hypothetical protein
MSQPKEEKNKALVLEAFDTLFNKRDYVAAQRYWSSNYIQHSAHIAPGREGLFNLIKNIPPMNDDTLTVGSSEDSYPFLAQRTQSKFQVRGRMSEKRGYHISHLR